MKADRVDTVIAEMAELLADQVGRVGKLIGSFTDLTNALEEIRAKYHINRSLGFNIFTSISDVFHRENLHSDILRLILDPRTETIGNSRNIELFIKLLESIKPGMTKDFSLDNLSVVREEGRIDLLIHDRKKGIIIENKINNATDMENQLARYYEYTKNARKLEVVAIVYLPLDERKMPSFEYTGDFVQYSHEVKDRFIHLPAVGLDTEKDYSHGFLDECTKAADNDETARVYLRHYSNLVKFLGGKVMSRETDKKIIQQIYSNVENIQAVSDIVEIWSNKKERYLIIANLLKEALIADGGFKYYETDHEAVCRKLEPVRNFV